MTKCNEKNKFVKIVEYMSIENTKKKKKKNNNNTPSVQLTKYIQKSLSNHKVRRAFSHSICTPRKKEKKIKHTHILRTENPTHIMNRIQ